MYLSPSISFEKNNQSSKVIVRGLLFESVQAIPWPLSLFDLVGWRSLLVIMFSINFQT